MCLVSYWLIFLLFIEAALFSIKSHKLLVTALYIRAQSLHEEKHVDMKLCFSCYLK